jgi:branched-chain amino acid transport system permease protein
MNAARDWWHKTSDGISDRIAQAPKPARIGALLAFILFLYLLPNKWFYQALNIPLGDYIPLYTTRSEMGAVLFICAYYIMLALGLNVVLGYAGLLDLGFFGFFAVGAYTTSLLASPDSKLITENHWFDSPVPWLLTVPLAVALALLSGVLLGWPTLRLRGDYLAIVTLGFAECIRIIARQPGWVLNGDRGIPNVGHPPGVFHGWWADLAGVADGTPVFSFDAKYYYWLALTVIIALVFLIKNLANSRVGRAWVAIREDEDAAELMGVPTFKYKLWAFAIGASIGGLAGSMWAGQISFVNATPFALQNSILVLAAVLLGGAGNIGGAILGAFLVIYVPEWLRSVGDVFGLPETVSVGGRNYDISPTSLRFFFFGLVLIVVMIFRPQGLWPNRRRAAEIKDRQKEAIVGV